MRRILVLAELAVVALVLSWVTFFPSSFLRHYPTSHLDFLYSVLHPLLMVIGFIILTGEAILAHRWMGGGWSREARKTMHLLLQGVAFGFGVLGIWAKFRRERGLAANFYSLHSWLGLLCLALFAGQWLAGFLAFFHRGESRRSTATMVPCHVFIGLYTYGLAVVTAETGLLEKLTFLQRRQQIAIRSVEAALVNGLGIGLMVLGGVIMFAAVTPRYERKRNKNNNESNGYHQNGKVHPYHNGNGGKWG